MISRSRRILLILSMAAAIVIGMLPGTTPAASASVVGSTVRVIFTDYSSDPVASPTVTVEADGSVEYVDPPDFPTFRIDIDEGLIALTFDNDVVGLPPMDLVFSGGNLRSIDSIGGPVVVNSVGYLAFDGGETPTAANPGLTIGPDGKTLHFAALNPMIGSFSGTITWLFTSTPINAAPTITSGTTASFAENGTGTVYTATATDLEGNPITWTVGGIDAGLFMIDSSTGALSFRNAPDYESPADSGRNNVYDLVVGASDGTSTASQAVAVTVTNVNEAAVITSIGSATRPENSIGVVYTAVGNDPEGDMISWSLSGADAGQFTIGSTSGMLTFNSAPNYEVPLDSGTNNVYNLNVVATSGSLTASKALAVTVTNVNEVPVNIMLSPSFVVENSATGSVVGTLTTTDPDAGDSFTYSLVAGSGSADNGSFTISGNQLQLGMVPNFEAKDSYTVRIRTTDAGGLFFEKQFAITITDVDEAAAITSAGAANCPENSVGAVYTATGSDPEGGTISWSLSGADADWFTIDGTTGALVFKSAPNYEVPLDSGTNNVYNLNVVATSGSLTASKALTITVTNVNEAPTGIGLSKSFTAENSVVGSIVGTLTTTDPDAGDTFVYALVAGVGADDNGSFAISGNQLQLGMTPNFEAKGSFSVRVQTSDAGCLTKEEQLVITITNVNEAPTDIALSGSSIAENSAIGSLIGELSSMDPDAGDSFTYTLVAGAGAADNGSFTISGNQLQLGMVPNFEAKNSYTVRIRTTDAGGLFWEELFTITITNVNEAAEITSLGTANFAENAVGTVYTATGSDPEGDAISWSLSGADADRFTIDGTSGELAFDSAPNYESPADSGTNNVYDLTVVATSGGLTASKALTVTVTNVNEAPMDILLSPGAVAENSAVGSVTGTLTTVDPDAGDSFTYTLVAGDGADDNGSFTISGDQLQLGLVPDFEAKTSYTVRIRATDAGSLFWEKQLAVTIIDANDAPTDLALSGSSIAENSAVGSPVGELSSTDPDAVDSFSYTLVTGSGDTDNASFTISGNELRLGLVPNFEAKNSYTVRIRTTDAGGLFREEQFTITISDVNDAAEITSLGTANFAENAVGTVYTAVGSDPEGDTISWSLSGTDAALFTIDGANGALTFGSAPNYESPGDSDENNVYDLNIVASSGGLTASKALAITVTDVNEAPVISSSPSVSFREGNTGTVITAAGTDPEGTALSWSISGADAAQFTIDSASGALAFRTAPVFASPTDSDANNVYELTLTATDGSVAGLTDDIALAVTVTRRPVDDDDHEPTVPTNPTSGATIIVNGQTQSAGTSSTATVNGQTVTTVVVDAARLQTILDTVGDRATVIIPVTTGSDVAVGALTLQMIQNMARTGATLVLQTNSVSYTLPAAEIDIAAVAAALGQTVNLSDITVEVRIAVPSASTMTVVQNAAAAGGFSLVVPPVEFTITGAYGGQTVPISLFESYVERTIAIPEGVDPASITTGVVVDPDGTTRHVPTRIVMIDGRYYAKLNSLTNSTYTVIWHPIEFVDMASHWAAGPVNDMASRLVMVGDSAEQFGPNRAITRGEFAATVIKALGLAPATGESPFVDLTNADPYYGYILTAYQYGIMHGNPGNLFLAENTITRQEAMSVIVAAMRVIGARSGLTATEVTAALSIYSDSSQVGGWARGVVADCLRSGIIGGRPGLLIAPRDNLTRAETAAIVQRLLRQHNLI